MINTTITKIIQGNHFDSPIGTRTCEFDGDKCYVYARNYEAEGDDYEIHLNDGRVLGFKTRSYERTVEASIDKFGDHGVYDAKKRTYEHTSFGQPYSGLRMGDYGVYEARVRTEKHTIVKQIYAPIKFEGDTRELSREKLNEHVKSMLYYELFSDGTEEERNLFVLGNEEGQEKNRVNTWAEAHTVYSKDVTLYLYKEIGEFKSVHYITSDIPWSFKAIYDCMRYIYDIDHKWHVEVIVSVSDKKLLNVYYWPHL